MLRAAPPAPLALALALCAGCAATSQRVVLECVPEEVPVYVDGRLLEGPRDELFLRSDVPHKIYVKGPGYEPRLVVLEPLLDAEGRPRLDEEVCIELVPVGQGRRIELEPEEPASGP